MNTVSSLAWNFELKWVVATTRGWSIVFTYRGVGFYGAVRHFALLCPSCAVYDQGNDYLEDEQANKIHEQLDQNDEFIERLAAANSADYVPCEL